MPMSNEFIKAALPAIPVRTDKALDKYDNVILFPKK